MIINHFIDPFPYILIDNFYNSEELELIWEELNFLCYPNKLQPPTQTHSAVDSEGKCLKQNSSIFLEQVYSDRNASSILNVNRKIFNHFEEVFENSPSWFFNTFSCNHDYTLISYYENSNHYKKHPDLAFVTMLTWFFKEPKSFCGGDLNFYCGDQVVPVDLKNNRCVIFPSSIEHSVEKVYMDENMCNKKLGRFCMTQFFHKIP